MPDEPERGDNPRAVSVRAAETCAEQVLRPRGSVSGAHYTGRADGMLILSLRPRAHPQIQTYVQAEPRDQKSVRAGHGVGVHRPIVSRETLSGNLHIVPFQCAPESLHVSTARRRSSRVGSMFRLVRSAIGSGARGCGTGFRYGNARPLPTPFPNQKTISFRFPKNRKRLPYPFENSSNIAPSSFLVGSLPCSQYMTPARSFSRA